jgi:hypothetical protein
MFSRAPGGKRTPGWRPLFYTMGEGLSVGAINSKLKKLLCRQYRTQDTGRVLTNADGRSPSPENQLLRVVDSVHVNSS